MRIALLSLTWLVFAGVAVAKPEPAFFPAITVDDATKNQAFLSGEIAVNGFVIGILKAATVCDHDGPNYCQGKLKEYRRVHPYFLRTGPNALRVAYGTGTFYGAGPFTFAFDVQLASSVDKEHWMLGAVIAHVATPAFPGTADSDKRAFMDRTFVFDGKLPEWRWATAKSRNIVDGVDARRSLLAAYQKLWTALDGFAGLDAAAQKKFEADLRASSAEFLVAGKLARPAEDGVAWLLINARHQHEKVPLSLRGLPEFEGMHMEIFANGKLARLKYSWAELIRFQGGAHDAPRGQPGPVEHAFDIWYRLDDKGAWQIDAVVPTSDD